MHRNVAKLVRPPHVTRDEVRVLTVEDARRLAGSIPGDRFEARQKADQLAAGGAWQEQWPGVRRAYGRAAGTAMKTLGNSQIGPTMNTYRHVLPEIEREVIDAAAKVICE